MPRRPLRRLSFSLPLRNAVMLAALPAVLLTAPMPVNADSAADHFEKAHSYYEKWLRDSKPEELDSALTEFAKARKASPKEPAILQWTGFIKLKQGKFAEALPYFQEAIRLSPDLPEPYINSGFSNAKLGRYPAAAAAYQKAIPVIKAYALKHTEGNKLRSQLRQTYYNLGEVYFKQNKLPEALDAYTRAADLNTDRPKELTPQEAALYGEADRRLRGLDEGRIQESLGGTLETQGNLSDAARAYERATLLEPNNARYWQRQGLAYRALAAKAAPDSDAAKGAWKQAGMAFGKAAELTPADYAGRELYAEALEEQGQSADALTQFERAAKDRAAAQQTAQTPSDTRYHDGLALAHSQRWSDAEEQFMLAAQAEPKNPAIYQWLGYVRLQQKTPDKYEAAVTAYKTADALKPDQAETHLALGRAYDALQRSEDAQTEFAAAAKLDPNSALAQYNLGSLYNRRQMHAEAAAAFQKALALDPNGKSYDAAQANAGLGYALHQLGVSGQTNLLDDAAAAQERAVKLNPALTSSWVDLAYIYFDQAQDVEIKVKGQKPLPANGPAQIKAAWDKAAAALAQVVEKAPETPKIRDVYAYALSKSNRGEDAITQFEKGVSLDEKSYEFLVTLAVDLDVAQRYSAAEDVYQRAIAAYAKKNQGENTDLLPLLGHVQMAQEKYAPAEATFAKVIAQRPEDVNAYVIRYAALQKLGRTNEAVAVLEDALKVNGGANLPAKERTERATVRRSLAYELTRKGGAGNLHRAAELYKASLTDAPQSAEAYNGLGAIEIAMKRYKMALPYLLRAVRLDSKSAEAYNNLGVAYEGLDKLPLAANNYRRALTIDPKNARAKANLARYAAFMKLRSARSK